MTAQASCPIQPPPPSIRWIAGSRLDGAWQMALDAALLAGLSAPGDPPIRSAAGSGLAAPVFRLYRWSRPTLSLGWHQHRIEGHWWELVRQGRLDLVRRPTGGRAVLHGADLTYSLVWPRPPGNRRQVYGRSLEWLVHAFAAMGQPLGGGRQAASLQRSSCFATSTLADLVHPGGAKRVGSAQLWRDGHLLQHGSIQLHPCPGLWRQVFGADPPRLDPLPLAGEALEAHLLGAAARWLPRIGGARERDAAGCDQGTAAPEALVEPPWTSPQPPPRTTPLSAAELAAAAARLTDYRLTASPSGDTSPELTMPRAT